MLVLSWPAIVPSHARELTFEDRVAAQAAIDRVHHAHQIACATPFDRAVPREALERKVRRYLQQSVALERFWSAPVTADALRKEAERMASSTRMPSRLRELYAALGNDPVLVQECLARPILVDRLVRARFARDERKRRAGNLVPDDAWDRWWMAVAPSLDENDVDTVASADRLTLPIAEVGASCAPQDSWIPTLEGFVPESREGHTAVWTGSRMIVWGGHYGSRLFGDGASYDPVTDSWQAISALGAPTGRDLHTAVWTGAEMIVWGGGSSPEASGGAYDPFQDRWRSLSQAGAPTARKQHTAVWTGTTMIVWGGTTMSNGNEVLLASGGAYAPASDTWVPIATAGAPEARRWHTAQWTGSRMIVWGGNNNLGALDSGGRYDPILDVWAATTTTQAPEGRNRPASTWTGTEFLVWGGFLGVRGYANSGGRYRPDTDTWSAMTVQGAPTGRDEPSGVWTGTEFLVWGGFADVAVDTGGRYDPTLNRWAVIDPADSPGPRTRHSAVWTGSEMLVWGGDGNGGYYADGGRYRPSSDSWTPMLDTDAPAVRAEHASVWTGSHLIVWSGRTRTGYYDQTDRTGSRYDPATNAWSSTTTIGAPEGRFLPSAVWTGTEMIVWGGELGESWDKWFFDSGGRYNPLTDTWLPTPTGGKCPLPRGGASTVWTGERMLVWGGSLSASTETNTGASYDPATDRWTTMSVTGAPGSRRGAAAVWTGSELIVWGGWSSTLNRLGTGGRYDPGSNRWATVSTVDAPAGRELHSAVWTGSEMIVWGGDANLDPMTTQTGGRYDPQRDVWTATSTFAAPAARRAHSAVWDGETMIVWGGSWTEVPSGGRYRPSTDSWSPTGLAGAPTGRVAHSAFWIGEHMLVWGGWGVIEQRPIRSGALYVGVPPADVDGDSVRCDTDCDDGNSAAWNRPSEVPDLAWTDGVTLAWSAPAEPGADAVTYDTLRATTPGAFAVATCLETADGSDRTAVDASVPEATFFYLVRGRNLCPSGSGTLGADSNGLERAGIACP